MGNVSKIRDCYGCGICAVSCPRNIIDIHLNASGFYAPHIINEKICTNCGMCLSVCSFSNIGIASPNIPLNSCAAWSKSAEIRQRCSSGGVGFELLKTSIRNGCKVIGVKYDADSFSARHYIAETEEEAISTIGSKYIQSYTVDAFKNIKFQEKYLITGTPCQIDSLRRLIKKKRCESNFILIDFFCHGVPSMNLWTKYSNEVEKVTGKIVDVSWRNKTNGWHDSWDINIKGKNTSWSSRWTKGDLFYKMFLSNSCLGKACYSKCKFKGNNSSADIRIGDLWGKTYKNDDRGVSAVVVFTDKGKDILKQTNCEFYEYPYNIVSEGQMHEHLDEPKVRGLVCRMLASRLPLRFVFLFVQMVRVTYLIKCKLKQLRKG